VKLTYTPDGSDKPQVWRYEPDKLLSSEAIAIEKVTGWSYEEFGMHLVQRAMLARKALLWVLLKRNEPTLRFDQIDPPVSAIELEYDLDELTAMRAEVEKNEDLTDAERRAALEFFDSEIDGAGEEAPKDQDESGGVTPISGPSRTSSTSRRRKSTA
jgi:hypothetical protein